MCFKKRLKKVDEVTYRTSEHVSPGHPDKVMDSIAEAVVDYAIDNSKCAPRVAVDGLFKNNQIILAGEITTDTRIPFSKIAKGVLQEIGYTPEVSPESNCDNVTVRAIITRQSPDIAMGVDVQGAGDIGIMYGGAIAEAPDYTSHSHYLSKKVLWELERNMEGSKNFAWLRPDMKSQVTIKYVNNIAVAIDTVVICVSHADDKSQEELRCETTALAKRIVENYGYDQGLDVTNVRYYVNPTGKFSIFGAVADAGEVGRKIVVDQYGGTFAVGGGNLNGKDATKVDRSGVYAARHIAKNLVALGYCTKCQIQVAYAIGRVDPISIDVDCYGTEHATKKEISEFVGRFSFRPQDIIKRFGLNSKDRKFKYKHLGMYGHIGSVNMSELPWEKTIKDIRD